MVSVEVIGFIAGMLVAVSLLPQLIKSWKTKSTQDISILWNLINITGQILWIIYGVAIDSLPLAVMSSITLAMAVSVLSLKIGYG